MTKGIKSRLHPFVGDVCFFMYWSHILMTWSLEHQEWADRFCSSACSNLSFFMASITSTTGFFCPFLQPSVYFLDFDMLRELIFFV